MSSDDELDPVGGDPGFCACRPFVQPLMSDLVRCLSLLPADGSDPTADTEGHCDADVASSVGGPEDTNDNDCRICSSLLFTTIPIQRGVTDHWLMSFLRHVLMQPILDNAETRKAFAVAIMDVGPVSVLRSRYSEAFSWLHAGFWVFPPRDIPSVVFGVARAKSDLMYGVGCCSTSTSEVLRQETNAHGKQHETDEKENEQDTGKALYPDGFAEDAEDMCSQIDEQIKRIDAYCEDTRTVAVEGGGGEPTLSREDVLRARQFMCGVRRNMSCASAMAGWIEAGAGLKQYLDTFASYIESSSYYDEAGIRLTCDALSVLASRWYVKGPPSDFGLHDKSAEESEWMDAVKHAYTADTITDLVFFVRCEHPVADPASVAIVLEFCTAVRIPVFAKLFENVFARCGVEGLLECVVPLRDEEDPIDGILQHEEWPATADGAFKVAPLCLLHHSRSVLENAESCDFARDHIAEAMLVAHVHEREVRALSVHAYLGLQPRADLMYQAAWCTRSSAMRALVSCAPDRLAPVVRILSRLGATTLALEMSLRYSEAMSVVQSLTQYVHQIRLNSEQRVDEDGVDTDVHRALMTALARACIHSFEPVDVMERFPSAGSLMMKTQLVLRRTLGAFSVPGPSTVAPVLVADPEVILAGMHDHDVVMQPSLANALWKEHVNCNARVPLLWNPFLGNAQHCDLRRAEFSRTISVALSLADLEDSHYVLRETRRLSALQLQGSPYTFAPVYSSDRPRLLDYLCHVHDASTVDADHSDLLGEPFLKNITRSGVHVLSNHPVSSGWVDASVQTSLSHVESHEARARSGFVIAQDTDEIVSNVYALLAGDPRFNVLTMYQMVESCLSSFQQVGAIPFLVGGCAWRAFYSSKVFGEVFTARPDLDIVFAAETQNAAFEAIHVLVDHLNTHASGSNGCFVGIDHDAVVVICPGICGALVIRYVETSCVSVDEAAEAVVQFAPTPYAACVIALVEGAITAYATPTAIQSLRTGIAPVKPTKPSCAQYESSKLLRDLQGSVQKAQCPTLPSRYSLYEQSTERRFSDAVRDGFVVVAMHSCRNADEVNDAVSVLCSDANYHVIAKLRELQRCEAVRGKVVFAVQHVLYESTVRRTSQTDVDSLRQTLAVATGMVQVLLPSFDSAQSMRQGVSRLQYLVDAPGHAPYANFVPVLPTLTDAYAQTWDGPMQKGVGVLADNARALYMLQLRVGPCNNGVVWYSHPQVPPLLPRVQDVGVDLLGCGDTATLAAHPAPQGVRVRAVVKESPRTIHLGGQPFVVFKCRVSHYFAVTEAGSSVGVKTKAENAHAGGAAHDPEGSSAACSVSEKNAILRERIVGSWTPASTAVADSAGYKLGSNMRAIEKHMALLAVNASRVATMAKEAAPSVLQHAGFGVIAAAEQRVASDGGTENPYRLFVKAREEVRNIDPDADAFYGSRNKKKKKRKAAAAKAAHHTSSRGKDTLQEVFRMRLDDFHDACSHWSVGNKLEGFHSPPKARCPWLEGDVAAADSCHDPTRMRSICSVPYDDDAVTRLVRDDASVGYGAFVDGDASMRPSEHARGTQNAANEFKGTDAFEGREARDRVNAQLYTWLHTSEEDGLDIEFVTARPSRLFGGKIDILTPGDEIETVALCNSALVVTSPNAVANILGSISQGYTTQLYNCTMCRHLLERPTRHMMTPACNDEALDRYDAVAAQSPANTETPSTMQFVNAIPLWEPQALRKVSPRSHSDKESIEKDKKAHLTRIPAEEVLDRAPSLFDTSASLEWALSGAPPATQ